MRAGGCPFPHALGNFAQAQPYGGHLFLICKLSKEKILGLIKDACWPAWRTGSVAFGRAVGDCGNAPALVMIFDPT